MPSPAHSTRYWPLPMLLTMLLSGCTSLALWTVNARARLGDYTKVTDIAYGTGKRQKLDVYRPSRAPATPLQPVVLFIHGGGWNSGDKHQYAFVGAALSGQGLVAMLPNYSLYPAQTFPALMADTAQAIKWAHDHAAEYGGDPERIYLVGHSAGAHLATLVALDTRYLRGAGADPRWIRGVVGLAGPYDFLPFTYAYMSDLFGPADRYPQSQPVNYVRADAPPMLLLHGAADTTVDPRNSLALADALQRAGAEAQAVLYPGIGHGALIGAFSPLAQRHAPALEMTVRFIKEGQWPRPIPAVDIARPAVAAP